MRPSMPAMRNTRVDTLAGRRGDSMIVGCSHPTTGARDVINALSALGVDVELL
jgi:hypothetical protein